MHRSILLFLVLFSSCFSAKELPFYSDSPKHQKAILKHQKEMNDWFSDPERSPMTAEDRSHFEGLDFFPISEKYQIQAKLVRTPGEPQFEMPTTTDRLPVYQKFGELHFELDGQAHKLNVYKSIGLTDREYRKYLFLPFRDKTSGVESYGGGRYLDLQIPKGDMIVIDFNRCYNPYCAYNDKYSCPIPPVENTLDIEILAGVKAFENH